MTDVLTTVSHLWQVFVTSNTLNFVIFIFLFSLLFKKIDVKGLIYSLHEKIVATIEQAKKTREEALKKLNEAEDAVKNLPQELDSIITDASKSAEVIGKKLLEDAQKQVENIKVNAEKVIEAEEKMLTSMLTSKASKASVEVAKSHITKTLELNPSLHEKYINESIDSLDRLNF